MYARRKRGYEVRNNDCNKRGLKRMYDGMKKKVYCVISKNGVELVTCGDNGCRRQSVVFVVEEGELKIKVGCEDRTENENN